MLKFVEKADAKLVIKKNGGGGKLEIRLAELDCTRAYSLEMQVRNHHWALGSSARHITWLITKIGIRTTLRFRHLAKGKLVILWK